MALGLPFLEALGQAGLHLGLGLEVKGGGGAVHRLALGFPLGIPPADAVKPLLVKIIRARFPFTGLPLAQVVAAFLDFLSVFIVPHHLLAVAAQHGELDGVTGGGVGDEALGDGAHGGGFHLRLAGAHFHLELETLVFKIGHELGHGVGFFANHPRGRERHAPAIGQRHLHAVEIIFRAPAFLAALDAPFLDLFFHRRVNLFLLGLHLGHLVRAAAHDVQRAPGEQAGDGVEVGGVHVAPHPRGLEGDGAAAAKAIAHLGPPAEALDGKFLEQARQRIGGGAKVLVDFRPRLGVRPVDFLRAKGVGDFLGVGGVAQFAPVRFLFLAALEAVLVHGENLEKNGAVTAEVSAAGHQQAQQDGTHEDERLAAPPFAEAGEGLAAAGLAFLVALGGEGGDGELGADERLAHGQGSGWGSGVIVKKGALLGPVREEVALVFVRRGAFFFRAGTGTGALASSSSPHSP